MGVDPISIALMLGGTAMQMSSQEDAADRKRATLNKQLERNAQASDKAEALVQDEGQRFDPKARLAGLQDQENKVYDQTQQDLQGAGGAQVDTAAGAGAVSNDFLKAKAQKAIDEGTRLTSIAREAAKARAPGGLHMDDSLSMAGLSGNLQNTWGTAKNMQQANALDAENIGEGPMGALGKIAGAIGGGMGARAARGGGAVPPNPFAGGISF